MKKYFLLLNALLIALVACTDQSKGEVQQLNTDWEKSNAAVQNYSNDLKANYERCIALRDTMGLPPGSLQKLGATNRESVRTSLKNMSDYKDAYIDLGRSFSPFFRQWLEKTERLSKLTIVVKNNHQLENQDIPTEIASLQAEVKNADANIKKWSGELKELKSKMEADYTQFMQQTAVLQ